MDHRRSFLFDLEPVSFIPLGEEAAADAGDSALSLPPMTGEDYLQRVRREASEMPSVVVANVTSTWTPGEVSGGGSAAPRRPGAPARTGSASLHHTQRAAIRHDLQFTRPDTAAHLADLEAAVRPTEADGPDRPGAYADRILRAGLGIPFRVYFAGRYARLRGRLRGPPGSSPWEHPPLFVEPVSAFWQDIQAAPGQSGQLPEVALLPGLECRSLPVGTYAGASGALERLADTLAMAPGADLLASGALLDQALSPESPDMRTALRLVLGLARCAPWLFLVLARVAGPSLAAGDFLDDLLEEGLPSASVTVATAATAATTLTATTTTTAEVRQRCAGIPAADLQRHISRHQALGVNSDVLSAVRQVGRLAGAGLLLCRALVRQHTAGPSTARDLAPVVENLTLLSVIVVDTFAQRDLLPGEDAPAA